MKILFLTRSLVAGGAERQLTVLAAALQARGHRVTVAQLYAGGALEDALVNSGVRLVDLHKGGRWNNLTFLFRLLRLLYQEKPDVLHGYHIVSNLLSVLVKPLFPRMKTVIGVRSADLAIRHYDWHARLCYRLEAYLSRFAELCIANSVAGQRRAVASGFPAKRVRVIPNGIDTERFRPDRAAGERLRAEWGIAVGQQLVGFVGRFDPMKDVENFCRAAARVVVENPAVRFVCVGRSDAEAVHRLQRLQTALGLEGVLNWVGERQDLAAVYSSFDLFCLSSRSESFPNVVCEAMACGTPCVVTDVGDARQIVGATGSVVPAEDAAALAQALLQRLADRRPLPDLALRERVIAHFSVARLLDASETELLALLGAADG